MRTQINGYDLAERAEDVERGARRGSGGPACCPSGPAVTGLSQPREKATRRAAQRGVINVRPSPSTMVMADKRLSGSSCRRMYCFVLWSLRRGKQQQSNRAVYGTAHPTCSNIVKNRKTGWSYYSEVGNDVISLVYPLLIFSNDDCHIYF